MSECVPEVPDVFTLVRDALEIADHKCAPEADASTLEQEAIRWLKAAIDVLEGRDPFEKKARGKSSGRPRTDWASLVGPSITQWERWMGRPPKGAAVDRLIRDVRLEQVTSKSENPDEKCCRTVLDRLLEDNASLDPKEKTEDKRRKYAEQLWEIVRKLDQPDAGGAGVKSGRGAHLAYVTPHSSLEPEPEIDGIKAWPIYSMYPSEI
jgi:hypothetical protein